MINYHYHLIQSGIVTGVRQECYKLTVSAIDSLWSLALVRADQRTLTP